MKDDEKKGDGGFEPFDKESKTGSPEREDWPPWKQPPIPNDGIKYPNK